MSKVSSGCCCSHYHIIRKVSNTLAGSALPLPPLTRSGRSSNSFQPTDYHKRRAQHLHLPVVTRAPSASHHNACSETSIDSTMHRIKGKLRWDGHSSIMHASGCPEPCCHIGFRHCSGFSVNRKYFVISCICAQKQYVDFRSY